MFCTRAYYTLILMIELAQVHKNEGVGVATLSERYNLPDSAFDGIIGGLEQAGYVVHRDERLFLQVEPDRISIWDIVESVDKIQEPELTELIQDKKQSPTSTAIMVNKEIEVVLKMIQHRLQRHKLSAWSERASKLFYT